MMEIAISAVKIIAGVYVGLSAILYFVQDSQIYVPSRIINFTPLDRNMPFENLRLTVPNGETISAWYIPAEKPTKLTLLFCHGNGGNICGRLDSIMTFHRMDMNVMIFDYQGYGESTGKTTEQGTYDDAMTAWNYLVTVKGLSPGDIIVFGRSLGGAVAIELAERVQPKFLFSESTFTSAPDMAAKRFPVFPARLLCKFKYNNIKRIKNVHCPVLIAHGPDDSLLPFEHGRRLFDAANEPKYFAELHGDHNAGGIDIDPALQKLLRDLVSK